MCAFATNAIRRMESRINLTLTCMLTVVAFKFVLQAFVPAVSYLTLLDWYMIATFACLGFTAIEAFFLSYMFPATFFDWDEDQILDFDEWFFVVQQVPPPRLSTAY